MAVTTFDTTDIREASIQFKNSEGSFDPGKAFGVVGTLSGEGEVTTVEKKRGSIVLKSLTKTIKMNMAVSAHVPLDVAREYFGLSNEGLKTGIYSAGVATKGKDFIFTVTAVDEFEENEKLMAFPICSNSAGFKIQEIEAGGEEVALLEFEFNSLPDEKDQFYYEAIVADLSDPSVKTNWHTAFNRQLVEMEIV